MNFRNILWLLVLCMPLAGKAQSSYEPYFLIAHRGGVVDSSRAENSLPALQEAARRGYRMIEIDMRLTKDRVFIIQHDADFSRFFGKDQAVADLTWPEIQQFSSDRQGSGVLSLEEAFRRCEGKLEVMIDNKVPGNDTVLFAQVVRLLQKYHLDQHALMIGTEASAPYFMGKIKLSCTRQQLEDYKKKPGFQSRDYYLFEGPDRLTQEDVAWARKEGIMTVAAVNRPYRPSETYWQDAMKFIEHCKRWGVRYFQIDSEFDSAFTGH